MSKETRDRIAFRMQPETRRRIEQWYAADNCQSKNEFIEKAVNFYVDYLGIRHSEKSNRLLVFKTSLTRSTNMVSTVISSSRVITFL